MQSLSPTVRAARVFEYETGITHNYPDLYAVNAAESKNRRVTRLSDIYAYDREHEYLIIWDHGVTAYYRSRQAPSQITPADIGRASARAKLLKSAEAR